MSVVTSPSLTFRKLVQFVLRPAKHISGRPAANQTGTFLPSMATYASARSRSAQHDTDPWEWRCGFYPGSHPGECRNGTSANFDEARADFEAAWQAFLSNWTESDFQAWRDQRDWTQRKYALWDAGKHLEPSSYGPGKPASRFMKCPVLWRKRHKGPIMTRGGCTYSESLAGRIWYPAGGPKYEMGVFRDRPSFPRYRNNSCAGIAASVVA